jgi:proline iminopeptidase
MIYLDQRGSGRSERPWTRHYQLDTLVADIEALRAALGVRRLALVGHSFGGTLAVEYAAAHPDRVARLVLVSAATDLPAACHARVTWLAAHYPTELSRARARAAADTSATASSDCALAFSALSGDTLMAYNNAVMFPDSVLRVRQDSVDAASGLRNTGELSRAQLGASLLTYRFSRPERLTMPVLILAGRHDSAIGLEPQRALAQRLPNARIVEYEHGGHFLYLDEPEHFASDVTAFVTAPTGERR